jgi:stearoyl-CoA desaturase (delta-9 desaturase)
MQVQVSADDHRIDWVGSIPFFALHVLAVVGVVLLGWSWSGFALALALYFIRIFGVTGGYHRYFSHRTFKTSRAMQLVFALLAMSSSQKGVIWWASHHRTHHRFSDEPGDVHSAKRDGFWWSHMMWILSYRWAGTDNSRVRDLLKYPELRWLGRYWMVPPAALAVGLFLVGGWWALVWGFCVSTVLCWHGTFTINSLSHMYGNRRYATTDASKNNIWLALLTFGEGWHNNHHHYQRSANQGFFWWEIDITYYLLRALAAVGLIWDLHTPPKKVLESNRIDAGAATPVDVLAAETSTAPPTAPQPLA